MILEARNSCSYRNNTLEIRLKGLGTISNSNVIGLQMTTF